MPITPAITKRVPVSGATDGTPAYVGGNPWGLTWSVAWGPYWANVIEAVAGAPASPVIDVTPRVTGVLSATSTLRISAFGVSLLLEGDESGDLLLEGDESGVLLLEGDAADFASSQTKRVSF